MILKNYDTRTLILRNLRTTSKELPSTYTPCQYRILCNIIIQKRITKKFFDFLLMELYGVSNWKELNYQQMYELIFVLNHWDYKRIRGCNHE